jgi:tetratricopeptide (TPR) repeat protein
LIRIINTKSILIGVLLSSLSFAMYFGDDFAFPKLENNLKEYYEVFYSMAYFNEGGTYNTYDAFQFNFNLSDDLFLSLNKKFISSRLTFGLMYKYFVDVDTGEVGIGIRNLGLTYADANSPYGQEYIAYTINHPIADLHMGLERIRNNGADLVGLFGGIERRIADDLNAFMYYTYNYIGVGLDYEWSKELMFRFSGYGALSGSSSDSYKAFEFGVVWLNARKSGREVKENVYDQNKFTAEALTKLRTQDKQVKMLIAKIRAVEYLYSEPFQQRLIQELVKQQIFKRDFKNAETEVLKSTLKHMQKGLEYYYLGDLEKAFQRYKMANSLYPNMPLIHERLGSIYYKLGHYDKAKTEWLLTLSLDPENKDAEGYLLRMEEELQQRVDNAKKKKDDDAKKAARKAAAKVRREAKKEIGGNDRVRVIDNAEGGDINAN